MLQKTVILMLKVTTALKNTKGTRKDKSRLRKTLQGTSPLPFVLNSIKFSLNLLTII